MNFRWIGKSADGNTITLHKMADSFPAAPYFNEAWKKANTDSIRIGIAIDVETTGLDRARDKIIELGMRKFFFHRTTGEVLSAPQTFSALQDPGEPLSAEVKKVTGLTDEMLSGKAIDWKAAEQFFREAHVILAHNASFDRPFLDRALPSSATKIWGCSLKQIDWDAKGYATHKLDVLSIYHGFFTDSHRALNDASALLYLVSHQEEHSGSPYLLEVLTNAKRPTARVIASKSPFDSKDHLRARKYAWDALNKFWHKSIYRDELEAELKWLETSVYNGAFLGQVQEIQVVDNFKDVAH
jgi:DNA polymerase III subunit epsilon